METGVVPPEQTFSIQVLQSRRTELTLYVEPWGEQYAMPKGAVFEIVAQGPPDGRLMLDYEDDAITVYGWTGSTVVLFRDGVRISP